MALKRRRRAEKKKRESKIFQLPFFHFSVHTTMIIIIMQRIIFFLHSVSWNVSWQLLLALWRLTLAPQCSYVHNNKHKKKEKLWKADNNIFFLRSAYDLSCVLLEHIKKGKKEREKHTKEAFLKKIANFMEKKVNWVQQKEELI